MNRIISAIVLITLSSFSLKGQDFLSWQLNDRYYTVQIGSGTSTYYGDLKHDDNIRRTFSNLNLGVEARLLNKVSARLHANYYNIKASDSKAKDSTYAQQRNLSFYSKNWDVSLNALFYLNEYKGDYYRRMQMEPYLFTGIGFTHLNPKTKVAGETIILSDFDTEGKDYSKITVMIPVGMGLKFKINTFMNFNLEASYRFTFSDYLDDVSDKYPTSYPDLTYELISNRKDEIQVVNQDAYENILVSGGRRGDPKNNDSYLFLNFQLEFYLPSNLFSGENSLFKKTSAGQ